jgi:hypothetical protein
MRDRVGFLRLHGSVATVQSRQKQSLSKALYTEIHFPR